MGNGKPPLKDLSQERLKELLRYDPETGRFVWRVSRGQVVLVPGEEWQAGVMHHKGYRRICLDRVRYLAHRLAWLYVYGNFPSKDIDHINGDRADNRIANLRECTNAQNTANQPKKIGTSSRFKGVAYFKRTDRWVAKFRHKHIGYYATDVEAAAAYEKVARAHFGDRLRLSHKSPFYISPYG